ncbi:hypothetical protein [Haloferax sp. CBA1149]|uniref:Uncharacterized protein n=3 Tax=Haloferax TaxID=2251 RepID=A0A6G1Z1Y0_9EURY|nr:hypothetical protein [Haloferax sp. CBA1149]KAB1187645.1 hypothetical protein Hfx1149_06210 [Haloferax sp. CBA1149]MRW80304.1 hypothetical protein [Haloferax marinisediminis]
MAERPNRIGCGVGSSRVGRGHSVVRRFVSRLRVRRCRRLVEATPSRKVCDLADVARATVTGNVTDVGGEGPAIATWTTTETNAPAVSWRATRPFVLDDGTGTISVRVPPDGKILVGDGHEQSDECNQSDDHERVGRGTTVEEGDRVTVTGRVVIGHRGTRSLRGPAFVVVSLR